MNYYDIIKIIPKPTSEQTESFIDWFTHAHSWYKHISFISPEQFVFYLDPNPMEFNSKDISMYGNWSYLQVGGNQELSIGRKPNTENGQIKRIYIQSNNDVIEIPEELINFSSIELTGCIHSGFKNMHDTKLLPDSELTCHESHIKEVEALKKHLFKILESTYR